MTEKNTTAIAEYSPTAAALADIATRMAKVVYDVSTPAGLAAAKKDRAEVRDLRVALEKKRVEIKAPALTRCREIDTEAARITAELLKYETPPDDAIKAEERRIEAERMDRARREEQRMADIHSRIAEFRGCVEMALRHSPMPAAQIAEHISDLEKIEVDDSFAEFRGNAEIEKTDALSRLHEMHLAAAARETEAERLRKDREDFERKRAELEAKDKAARDAEDERQRKERAKFEAEQAAERARVAAENARIAAEQAAAQKVIDDQRRELEARQQAERDAQAQREREAREATERAERETEAQRIANYRPSFDEIVALLAANYCVEPAKVRTWISEAPVAKRAAA